MTRNTGSSLTVAGTKFNTASIFIACSAKRLIGISQSPIRGLVTMSKNDPMIVKTDGGEGVYVISREGVDCFTALLKALGYTATIEEIEADDSGKNEEF